MDDDHKKHDRWVLSFLYNTDEENIISKLPLDVVSAIVKEYLPKKNRFVINIITSVGFEYYRFLRNLTQNELLGYMRNRYVMPDGSEIPDSFHLGRYVNHKPIERELPYFRPRR